MLDVLDGDRESLPQQDEQCFGFTRRRPVQDSEDCDLGFCAITAEGFGTDKCVQVVVPGGGHHAAVAGHGGQNSGFELTGVGDDEHVARIGDDARAQWSSESGGPPPPRLAHLPDTTPPGT